MKNYKSPGSDSFTAEFVIVLCIYIGRFVLGSIHYSYQIGKISVLQNQGVITCIPKERKVKTVLKKKMAFNYTFEINIQTSY